MFTETVVVSGMTCRHCVASVTEEIQERLPAVSSVEVELSTGRTVVRSGDPISAEAVREAVQLAGFRTLEPATG